MQVQWRLDPNEVPTLFNQVLLQAAGNVNGLSIADGCYLTLGHVAVPVIPEGLSAEELEDFGRVNVLSVNPVGRFYMSFDRLRELRYYIDEFLSKNGETDGKDSHEG